MQQNTDLSYNIYSFLLWLHKGIYLHSSWSCEFCKFRDIIPDKGRWQRDKEAWIRENKSISSSGKINSVVTSLRKSENENETNSNKWCVWIDPVVLVSGKINKFQPEGHESCLAKKTSFVPSTYFKFSKKKAIFVVLKLSVFRVGEKKENGKTRTRIRK